MKKIISVILAVSLLLAGIGGVCASALFGTGVAVMAEEVTLIKTGLLGRKLVFADTDFKSALSIPDFDELTVKSLPPSTEGTLLLAGRRVSEGQTIKRKNVGALVFVPASSEITESGFGFTIDNAAGGAVCKCVMKFIDKVNYPPEISDDNQASVSLTTQSEISVYGRMEATDPEGDALEYIVVSYPKEGTLTVIDSEEGRYKYTPLSDFTGYDEFTYVARDSYGNYSKPQSIKVKVIERMSSVVYVDMGERDEYNAAVAMSAMGVMNGTTVGDDVYFLPDARVSRAEFVTMAMKAAGIRPDSSLTSSFFDDNGDIPPSLVGYVATAQRAGIIDGDFGEDGLVFRPNESITKYEAAGIMAALLGINSEGEGAVYGSLTDIPVWARGDVMAMYTLGIFDTDNTDAKETDIVSRAMAAEYLYRMVKI